DADDGDDRLEAAGGRAVQVQEPLRDDDAVEAAPDRQDAQPVDRQREQLRKRQLLTAWRTGGYGHGSVLLTLRHGLYAVVRRLRTGCSSRSAVRVRSPLPLPSLGP